MLRKLIFVALLLAGMALWQPARSAEPQTGLHIQDAAWTRANTTLRWTAREDKREVVFVLSFGGRTLTVDGKQYGLSDDWLDHLGTFLLHVLGDLEELSSPAFEDSSPSDMAPGTANC